MKVQLLTAISAMFLACTTPSSPSEAPSGDITAKPKSEATPPDPNTTTDSSGMTIERQGPGGVKMIKEKCRPASAGVKGQRQQVEVGISQPIDGKNTPNPPSPETYTKYHCEDEN